MARAPAEIRDLGTSAADRALLSAFYKDLYIPAFPDADERESLDNIQRYLEKKATGWYGANSYHVHVRLEDGQLVGGAITDYLAGPNTGVIEFLVTSPARRGRGLGRRLLDDAETALAADARAAGAAGLRAVVAEMNDPFRSGLALDSMDPFTRLLIWSGWGYAGLDFPYVQPALSDRQKPVTSMLLAWKPVSETGNAVASATVKQVLHEYMRWAMRLDHPQRSAEFTAMARHLDARTTVPLLPLDHYVGHDQARPLDIREVTTNDSDLPEVRAVYAANFADRATALDAEALGCQPAGARGGDHAYHLWALRATPEAPVAGLASFFTLPEAGFGGYVALAPPLRGTGRVPLLLARVETQMVRDRLGATGWFVECDDHVLARFRRVGFHEVAIPYRQPPLRPGGPAPALHLLYKVFGRAYAPPVLTGAVLLAALRRIQTVVYGIERPEDDVVCREIARAIDPTAVVPLR